MSIRSDRCPTCGQAVQTRTSSEGTSCYLPTGEVERLREAIRLHRERVTDARDEHGPPILPLDAADTDLWAMLDAAGKGQR